MHKNSMSLYVKYAAQYVSPGTRVLEIGPDKNPSTYQGLSPAGVSAWETIDFAGRTDIELTHRQASEYSFPMPDNSYDVVVSGQVIEHVKKVWRWMPELARVCKPGGYVITINPVTYHYHEAPVDCWRIYPEGMKALCEDSGLDVVLSKWESVSIESLRKVLPDLFFRTMVFPRMSGVFDMLSRVIKTPADGAFDTVTIARKPLSATP